MRHLIAALALGVVAACGGGGGSSGGGSTGGSGSSPPPPPVKPTSAEAGRLLTQATFGPTETSITTVQDVGFSAWIDSQIAAPVPAYSAVAHIDERLATLGVGGVGSGNFYEIWWEHAITEPGQLRERTAFALSQIFVISLADGAIDVRGAASYYDMLERNAFGNFRTLLQDVTLHPMMGRYLTFLGNQKEDLNSGRTPDENYAREVMQLMTIGLQELNTDGTVKLNAGQPIPTYTSADIAGLAKVFTGISWYHTSPTNSTFSGGNAHSDRSVTPMIFYPQYHSTSEKSFLGTTIPPSTTVDVAGDLKIALDKLYNHPNVGPFIATRLIQQMVTSNPSPAYVGRVAAVFANNGSGVRGDMGAVVKAVLMDAEARDMTSVANVSFGKLREPVIRLANWARAFGATSQSGLYLITSTSGNTSLSQSPLNSPSVFNFWRPGFTPPGSTELGSRSLLAPEFQTVDEVTTASYINVMQDWINAGIGSTPPGGTGRDVRATYAAEVALADNPAALVERMNTLLFYGQMSTTLRDRIIAGVTAVTIPAATGSNQATIDTAKLNRAKTAIFFSMISPEYLAQR
jgi:uncharacterized protein (DUF1800 family)